MGNWNHKKLPPLRLLPDVGTRVVSRGSTLLGSLIEKQTLFSFVQTQERLFIVIVRPGFHYPWLAIHVDYYDYFFLHSPYTY